ncbi:MAG: hypothetical protein GTO45_05255 [Candidatus Aminicenantes bacterium]|nr:hypothetical protein [Candidatus Aminicenantes bacterium]NIN17493.1 hypothetical protein [Candidatus Aminicenantes bacterium]NIN41379.1 hypothetical protein [Candidatus Aminicenantes bacterium]NIN84145.1 hypothetical protein [Candidatus Aminicenantes bacterium]NIO86705.1 hypothetical protein [Candidatus Aminicenantes bacterium]
MEEDKKEKEERKKSFYFSAEGFEIVKTAIKKRYGVNYSNDLAMALLLEKCKEIVNGDGGEGKK